MNLWKILVNYTPRSHVTYQKLCKGRWNFMLVLLLAMVLSHLKNDMKIAKMPKFYDFGKPRGKTENYLVNTWVLLHYQSPCTMFVYILSLNCHFLHYMAIESSEILRNR
jgi:hypothetical protein